LTVPPLTIAVAPAPLLTTPKEPEPPVLMVTLLTAPLAPCSMSMPFEYWPEVVKLSLVRVAELPAPETYAPWLL
jgi:hypothetical protein